jgi:hypothetical protein
MLEEYPKGLHSKTKGVTLALDGFNIGDCGTDELQTFLTGMRFISE